VTIDQARQQRPATPVDHLSAGQRVRKIPDFGNASILNQHRTTGDNLDPVEDPHIVHQHRPGTHQAPLLIVGGLSSPSSTSELLGTAGQP
jgi:hypothetical protein